VLRELALALFSSVENLGEQDDGGNDDPGDSLMLAYRPSRYPLARLSV
jgi:hypothetical protein